jgi:hypothetical protein
MTNAEIMFLPDFLRDGIAGATVNGQKVAEPPVLILPGNSNLPAGVDQPFIVMLIIALITIAGLSIPRLKIVGRIMSSLLLFITGILGCLILIMWFWTDHQSCRDNFNLLWCLPTNLIIAFFKPKGAGRYALVAMALIFIALLVHILKIQQLALLELSPLLLALLWIYGTVYKRSKIKSAAYA